VPATPGSTSTPASPASTQASPASSPASSAFVLAATGPGPVFPASLLLVPAAAAAAAPIPAPNAVTTAEFLMSACRVAAIEP
jgi:hypothetical protein